MMMTPLRTLIPILPLGFQCGVAFFHDFGYERKKVVENWHKNPTVHSGIDALFAKQNVVIMLHECFDGCTTDGTNWITTTLKCFSRCDAGDHGFVGWIFVLDSQQFQQPMGLDMVHPCQHVAITQRPSSTISSWIGQTIIQFPPVSKDDHVNLGGVTDIKEGKSRF
jgi:hypothetical protein